MEICSHLTFNHQAVDYSGSKNSLFVPNTQKPLDLASQSIVVEQEMEVVAAHQEHAVTVPS